MNFPPPAAEGPRDVLPHDHPDLTDDRRIIRRISNEYVVPDENLGCGRLSSAIFKNDPRNGSYLSVDSEHCITQLGRDPAEFVATPRWFGALSVSIKEFRSIDAATKPKDRWKIGMVPVAGNDCHCAVWGKITKGQSNDLQRKSDWLVPISGVEKLVD